MRRHSSIFTNKRRSFWPPKGKQKRIKRSFKKFSRYNTKT